MPITDEMVTAAQSAYGRAGPIGHREKLRIVLEAVRPLVVAECAAVAGAWKSALQPGALERLAGHEEAARDIKRAILALAQETGR